MTQAVFKCVSGEASYINTIFDIKESPMTAGQEVVVDTFDLEEAVPNAASLSESEIRDKLREVGAAILEAMANELQDVGVGTASKFLDKREGTVQVTARGGPIMGHLYLPSNPKHFAQDDDYKWLGTDGKPSNDNREDFVLQDGETLGPVKVNEANNFTIMVAVKR